MEQLGINLGFLISQIVNFGVLAAILYVLLYRPVLNMLDRRRARIQQGIQDAELAERRAAEAEQDYQRRIEDARREGQRIIAQAAETSQKVAEEIKAKAEAEAEEIRRRAVEQMERERAQLSAELRQEVGDLSIAIAKQLIGATLDEEAQRKLIAKFLREAEGLS